MFEIKGINKKEFEKQISSLERSGIDLEETTLKCTIWHSYGLTLEVNLMDSDYNTLIDGIMYTYVDGQLEDNEENLEKLKKEQKKMATKIKKWNENYNIKIVVDEQNC